MADQLAPLAFSRADGEQEIVVNVAVLASRFTSVDNGLKEATSLIRDLDRGLNALGSKFDIESNRIRSQELSFQALVAALTLRVTAMENDMRVQFQALQGQVGNKLSTAWVERSIVFVKDLVPWAVAAGALLGKIHFS